MQTAPGLSGNVESMILSISFFLFFDTFLECSCLGVLPQFVQSLFQRDYLHKSVTQKTSNIHGYSHNGNYPVYELHINCFQHLTHLHRADKGSTQGDPCSALSDFEALTSKCVCYAPVCIPLTAPAETTNTRVLFIGDAKEAILASVCPHPHVATLPFSRNLFPT